MYLPEDFIKYTKALMGDSLWQALENGLACEQPVSIRLNPLKCTACGLHVAGKEGDVPWCETGIYLRQRPAFTFDPLMHAGLYYVQEASSMFTDRVIRQFTGSRPVTMLDLCAAPGGKSAIALGALPEGSLLVSNEPVRTRAQILAENIWKYGHKDVIVTNNYPKDFRKSGLAFDVILADVPCSGEGMFRKDGTAVREWSRKNVERCSTLQREILTDAWLCLKPGGILVYSTCTFNAEENENNAAFIADVLGAEALAVETNSEWNITGPLGNVFAGPAYRFLPGRTKGEGLFMAVFRKNGESNGLMKCKSCKMKKARQSKTEASPCAEWLKNPDCFDIEKEGNVLSAIPRAWKDTLREARKSLRIISAGIKLGELKGKDIVPSQQLALSASLDKSAFPTVELDYGQAVNYLRKETAALPQDTPKGYILVTYDGMPLGFEKNIGNRANNLYPAEWKIKSSHVPKERVEVIKYQL